MSRRALSAAALPGVAVALAALAGWVPQARDIPAYFVPLREHTARVLKGEASPFWNEQVGCGEPLFANPQSALLYPPAWLALLLPPATAVGVEVGLHLALLGVGTAWLARRLGAAGWWAAAAGLGAVSAGPVMDSAGVLNNLTALTWLPWAWEAALAGALKRCAAFSALAFFAGEPQLAALGAVVSLLLAPARRTAQGVLLAGGIIAVQAIPFAFWVAGGDRGAAMGVEEAARGGLPAALLPALAFPGAGTGGGGFLFVVHPTLPLWVLLGVALALARAGPARRLALATLAGVAAAALASTPAGEGAWTAVTLGLLRYPARLLLPAAVMGAAAAVVALGRVRWRMGVSLALAMGLATIGVLAAGAAAGTVVQAVAAGLATASPWGAAAATAGSLALAAQQGTALALGPPLEAPVPCLEAQQAASRVYLVEPSRVMLAWVAEDPLRRTRALGLGYHPLQDGRRVARTFAPLASADLAAHLRQADRGPAGRWWLDSLAADAVVSVQPIAGLPVVCRGGGLVVSANPQAWPHFAVVAGMPPPGANPVPAGELLHHGGGGSYHRWTVRVDNESALLLRLDTPDRGWRYRVDGQRVSPLRGAGILQGVPVPPGEHVVEARHRPPGLGVGAGITLVALLVMASPVRRSRRRSGGETCGWKRAQGSAASSGGGGGHGESGEHPFLSLGVCGAGLPAGVGARPRPAGG